MNLFSGPSAERRAGKRRLWFKVDGEWKGVWKDSLRRMFRVVRIRGDQGNVLRRIVGREQLWELDLRSKTTQS